MTPIRVIFADQPPTTTLGARLTRAVAEAWRTFERRRRRRATQRILASLDARTLKDIGIDPSEITSYARGDRDYRRNVGNASWRGSSHA